MRRIILSTSLLLVLTGMLPAETIYIKHSATADRHSLTGDLNLPGTGEPALLNAPAGNRRGLDRIIRWELPEREPLGKWLNLLNRQSQIEYAELPVVRRTSDWPNDGDGLYALEQVAAAAAWDVSHGDPAVVIAVIDVGTDSQHEDLQGNLYANPLEAGGEPGVDDDDNGYVDDVHGWDFEDDDNDPAPANNGHYHGTHVAGTACAVTDNGLGVAAIAWNTSFMPVRVGSGSTIYSGYEGIYYAAHNGADVINLSWGGDSYSAYESDVIQDAIDQGVVVVAAAGNVNNSAPHYPAAYQGVIAVANVNVNDVRSTSSCYGEWVALSAPGVMIESTMPDDSYSELSGTSMATPQVASLLGLLKSYRPGWSGAQLTQQVIFTTDDIDDVNPGYEGLLGTGRINAASALGEMSTAIRLSDVELEDSSGDGILDPGESVTLWVTLTNYLSPIDNYNCQLSCDDPYITITESSFSGGPLGTGDETWGELQFEISGGAGNGHPFRLLFALSANSGDFTVNEYRSYVILPLSGDHDNGNCRLTVSSFGALGYYDNVSNQLEGSGFQYPVGANSSLYHGSLLVGVDEEHVSDCASWNQSGIPYDFVTAPGGDMTIELEGVLQESHAVFNDSDNDNSLPVEVQHHGISLSETALDDGVILNYSIRNTGNQLLPDLQAALWMDFDVQGSWSNDYAGYDQELGLGYQRDASGVWIGMGLLSHEPASFRNVDNDDWVGDGFTDAEKYQLMTEGFVHINPDFTSDWSCFQSVPAVDLGPGEQHTVSWAVLGGNDQSELENNFVALREYYLENVTHPDFSRTPDGITLRQNYPNPFNPITTIEFTLAAPQEVELMVFNTMGQVVNVLAKGQYSAGTHQASFYADNFTSGIYFYRLQSGAKILTRKMVVVK